MKLMRFSKQKKQITQLNEELRDRLTQLSDVELFSVSELDIGDIENISVIPYSYWRSVFRTFFKNKIAAFFLTLITLVLLFTYLQPFLPNQKDPIFIYNDEVTQIQIQNAPPSEKFWFGTNAIGQDLWSRTWSGTRTSLLIGISVALVDAFVGVFMGILWGYVRKLDGLFTELYNVFDNIPQTLVLILLTYVLRPSIVTIIFAMSLTSWLVTARFIRNQVIIIRDRDYNIASKFLGTPTYRIILRNLLPYLVSVITMRMALSIPAAIGNEIFISYIGLGLPVSIPSLGNLIQSGIDKMMEPALRYQLLSPTLVLSVITISFYIIGNAFADACDPKNHME